MNFISKILMGITVLLTSVNSFAQIKYLQTATIQISGNCGMCKATIEKAGNVKNIATVAWNKDTKIAAINYDGKKTTEDEILKRIALAGYDNSTFLAPNDVYAKLPGCCQYDRELKPLTKNKGAGSTMKTGQGNHHHNEMSSSQNTTQLNAVFNSYFSVKDDLVKTDAGSSSAKAKDLIKSINAVEMTKLSTEEHSAWMKVMKDLTANSETISANKEIAKQREAFAALSKNIYELAKVSKLEIPLYYQHCPMYDEGKGANWLSKEKAVKNPYYGAQMLTCGNTVETLK